MKIRLIRNILPAVALFFCVSFSFAQKNTLKAGESLKGDEFLTSENGNYVFQAHAHDALYCSYGAKNGKRFTFIPAYSTGGISGNAKRGANMSIKSDKLVMQTDGNLVAYDKDNKALWSSKTHPFFDPKFKDPKNKPVKLVLENDGSANLYNATGAIMWSTKKI